jgi:2-polyprenyl-3-methyl-5-hydroxy-6-metoxy-1,4-benzoquinol methylase
MFINTKYRSTETEIMDDLSMKGEMLKQTLDQLAVINHRLGGNRITIKGVKELLKEARPGTVVSIIDLGCGGGDMLRIVADYGRKNSLNFKLTGVDANEFTINYARELSADYPEISYMTMNVFDAAFQPRDFDIVLATLFLHHFTWEKIESLLKLFASKMTTGIIINDLHRSNMAYVLFRMISMFISNRMTTRDGALSVLKGFKKHELINVSKKIPGTSSRVRWKWAFRYQWIIKKQ